MVVSGDRLLGAAVADGFSDYLRLADFLITSADDGTRRRHKPAAAIATCSDSDSSSPEAAESAPPAATWQPLPRSVPKRRRVGTSPTTGSAAPPRHAREAREKPKPSTASCIAPAQREAQRKAFLKWWNQRRPRAPAPPPPPQAQSNQDAGPTPSPAEASKDCQPQGFMAQLAFAAAVILGVRAGLTDVLSGWNQVLKVIFLLSLILGAGMLAAGLMATSPVVSTGYTRTVLSTCARLCTCLAAFMLILDFSFLMGSSGYIVGIILGLAAVLFAVSVWMDGDPDAYGFYMRVQNGTKRLCGCFKWSRERGPILPR